MSTVLLISTSLPPVADSQTIRNVFLIRGLLDRGHRVHLIQPPCRTGDASLEELLAGRVERTVTRAPAYDVVLDNLRASVTTPGLRRIFHRALARLAGIACVPDVRVGWDRKACAAALMASAAPDVIVSSSGSNTAHLAAARLARHWKKPWIAEFGDPWSLNPLRPASYPHIRYLNRLIEKRTLGLASGIVFTTRETCDAFIREGIANGVPTMVVPCGYDPDLLNGSDADPGDSEGEFVLAYTGTAEKGSRDLSPIIDALLGLLAADASLPSVRIRLLGSVDRSFGESLPPGGRLRVEHLGWVRYGDSIRELKKASGLILIGNRSSLQMPAKVYNYIASGKPIIYLAQRALDSDPTWQLLKDRDQCSVVAYGSAEIRGTALAFIRCVALDRARNVRPGAEVPSWAESGARFSLFLESVLASSE